ncbi:MAG: phosphoribosylanthranilate isomerase [Haliea sp.]|nr:phosphoribosylanthranilate isomerase [Haliea sp.]
MTQTRIKICGITRPEDAREAVAGGADAIGMVFYPPSPRAISVVQAAEIVDAISPFVTVVALVVDKPADDINRILEQVPVDLIQFHGDESPAFCRQFARPWMKALRVREDTDIASACGAYGEGRAILLDAWQEGVPGGTGMRFDWGLVSRSLPLPVVLAGGLNEHNVAEAVATVKPAAVDVSSGVECSPGIKDAGKIRRFIAAVRAADQQVDGTIDDQ